MQTKFLKIWLLSVNENLTSINKDRDQSESSVWRAVIGRTLFFIEVNFSKLTDSNQIFRNDFVCIHYHLCKISTKFIECIIFLKHSLY